jgi:hypothetical protein
LFLALGHDKELSYRNDQNRDNESSPDSRDHQDTSSKLGTGCDVSIPYSCDCDNYTVDSCEVRVELDQANCVLIWPLEEPQKVGEDQDSGEESASCGDSWVVLNEALKGKTGVGGETIGFTETFGVDICVLAVVEDGLY